MPHRGLRKHSPEATGIPFSLREAGAAPFDWTKLHTKNQYAPGKDQGQSASCTSQATGYGIFAALGIDISREDMYANTKLPGGGSYLVSPWQWLVAHGYLTLAQHPDPSPETEEDMSAPTGASDAQRRKCVGTLNVFNSPTIDEVAQAIYDHDIVCIGITWTDQGFERSWTEPAYLPTYSGADGHDLWCMNPTISQATLHAIDTQSSWWEENGPDGKSTHHEIDEDFFANGGVFELLTVDIIKGNNMNPNVKTVNYNGAIGVMILANENLSIGAINTMLGTDLSAAADGTIATELTVVDKQ